MRLNSNQILGLSIIILLVVGPIVLFVFHVPFDIGLFVLFGIFAFVQGWAKYYQTKRRQQIKEKAESDYLEMRLKEIEENAKKVG